MRRMSLLFGIVSLISVGTIGAVVACGDDDSNGGTTPDPDAAASSSGASSSGASSSGASGTTSSSGAPSDDGGADGGSSSGDLASNPGQYTCGTTVCDAGGGFGGGGSGGGGGPAVCCLAAAEANTKCSRSSQCDNQGNNGNLAMRCDEAADCQDNQVCCYDRGFGGQPTFTASCRDRNQCASGFGAQAKPRPYICKSSAECGDAGACNEKTCDGFKLHVCGSPDGCK